MHHFKSLAALCILGAFAPLPAFATYYPVAGLSPRVIPASFNVAAVPAHHARIDFVGHSSFEIESPKGVRIVTDYNGYVRPGRVPHIVTMNRAHDTHFTDFVEKDIQFALRGWHPKGGIARHNLSAKDVRVRNVPTNIEDWGGKLVNNNSMSVIEMVGLCIVHIGHLHHVLSKDQLRDLGRIDIAFAPIDGMWTMSHQELFEVLDAIKPMLIIPMHFGSMGGVEAFVAKAGAMWKVRRHEGSSIELTFRDLPRKTEVLFLQGY
jgi:L-ascorbate metabolism protein UlaG (beta-lactamase superfamily)